MFNKWIRMKRRYWINGLINYYIFVYSLKATDKIYKETLITFNTYGSPIDKVEKQAYYICG